MNPATRLLICTLMAVAGVAGCATTTAPPTSLTPSCQVEPFPEPYRDLDPCASEAVLTAAVIAIFTYRPADHTDQRVAFRSADPLLTRSFAAAGELSALVWTPITSGQWQQWRRDSTAITTTVRMTDDDHPTDSTTEVDRVLVVHVAAAGQQATGFAVYAHAHRAGGSSAWLLSGLQVFA